MTLTVKKLCALLACCCLSSATYAATEKYQLDPNHTFVLFHINHFGFSNPVGRWSANGTLHLDEKDPRNSTLNVIIPIDSLTTGVPALDKHLESADFFASSTYPTATFISNKIEMISNDSAIVSGVLTLHGISKKVVLKVTLNKIGVSPITKKKTAGFTAITELHRSDFGMTKYAPGLSDNVKLDIQAEADLE